MVAGLQRFLSFPVSWPTAKHVKKPSIASKLFVLGFSPIESSTASLFRKWETYLRSRHESVAIDEGEGGACGTSAHRLEYQTPIGRIPQSS